MRTADLLCLTIQVVGSAWLLASSDAPPNANCAAGTAALSMTASFQRSDASHSTRPAVTYGSVCCLPVGEAHDSSQQGDSCKRIEVWSLQTRKWLTLAGKHWRMALAWNVEAELSRK